MKSFAWLRARPRTLASAGIVTASAVAITLLAVGYEGFPTTEVDLHDGGVWVTKNSSMLVGHFNHESQVLDGGLRTTSDEYDVLQSGETVLVVDAVAGAVTSVDPALVVLTDSTPVPSGAVVELGGPTVAVLDPSSGDLWVVPSRGISSFEVQGTDPVATLGAGADVAVATDGTVFAVSKKASEIVTVPVDAEGSPGDPATRGIDAELGDVSITAVGTTGVVLDSTGGTLYTTDGATLPIAGGDTAVLQHPSAGADAVTLATASSLVRVPFDGSASTEQSSGAQGAPAAPVWLGGCAYGAWSGSATFVRDCLGDTDDLDGAVEGADEAAVLRFRVNRDVVVLNDIIGGAAWMASDSMQRVENWNDVTPPEGETEEDEQTTEESVETTLPDRTEQNTPPIANPDEFGVRPGRTTYLPVLDNDSDADGDVLAASVLDPGPGFGDVQPVNNGAALQIAVPADAEGSTSFSYEVDDGRGGTASAAVRLTVRGLDVNAPPTQKRVTTVTIESGGTVTYNVLPDWIDPDGDDVFLKAVTPSEGDEADFTSDGRITYRAIGGTQGRKDIPIVVSDGTEMTAGIVRFDVRPVGSTVPVTNADHVVVRSGQTVTVAPLANDTSSSREPLRLTRVDEVAGTTIVPDFANKTFTFSAPTAGTYYVQYLVAAGANAVPGLVRVDVIDGTGEDLPPIAVRDVALLPSGGEVLVNVLANDTDPAGGILVVQSVTVAPGTGVAVAVLNHETLRIADQSALAEQVRISYRVSNGSQTAEGEVVVIPVPAPAQLRPPVGNDDQAIVRAGDVVTIPVLANDYHPNGDAIHVAPELVAPLPDPKDGEIFVSQDTIRFKAGPEPGTVYATYEVVDSTGQKDSGYVTIQVLPVNEETNAAPRPRDLTSRVLSGSRVRIAVPLDGIDPDGDSVQLVGIERAPQKGRIVETGADFLVYEAFDGATGVDAFTYRVRDRLGKEATAPIRIGIAPAESLNQAPYAVKDSVIMRPGRTVAVPVTANDSDPDGDAFGLVKDGLILPDVPGLKASVQGGDRVLVTSPDEPVETSLQYTIRDARGAEATAVLQITVKEDVPLQRPIARDDRVLAQDITGETVDVEVLANDEDPDGTRDALDVTVAGSAARVLADGRVRVTPGETDQLLTYTITDPDGLAASAFLFVPALGSVPPTARTQGIEVRSGETIEVPIADHVQAAGGKSVIITESEKVTAVHSNGASLVKDQKTLVYTSADRYFGQDALTFEVTDGTGPDDSKGRKATITIPVTVLPPENQQPSFVDGQMNVAPGEEATTLDLRALTTDPDPDDLSGMRYTLVGAAPSGFTASIDSGRLQVSAAAATKKGTTIPLTVEIDDGETEPIRGSVTVQVTASTRPLATANDDTVEDAPQGRTVTVPVLANDFNPFPDTPLKIVTAVTETGVGVPKVVGDRIEVTPDKNFFGTMVVRYRVQDATEDADREVEGRIRLTVQGRPDAPGIPVVSSVQDRTVVLSWTPPPNNGAEITGYTVTAVSGGTYTRECPATTCTLSGLTNNVEYNFVVTATNRVGTSDPSAPSETARPDARPDTPNPPTLVFGDRRLQVAWQTPTTPGSPVEKFTLEISPAPPSGITQKTNVTGNALTWEGLENGVAYQVRVQAHNRAPEPSSWSVYSATMVPAAPPAAAAAPTTARLNPVPPQAQMQVAWTAPANNGDTIDEYRLNILQGGSVVRTITGIPGSQLTQAVSVDASTTDYTFSVAAHNKAGWGPDSAASAPRRAFVAPGAPTNVVATTPVNDSAIVVTYGAAAGNGANAGELRYEYSLGGGVWRSDWDGRRITAGIANNNSYQVSVRAYTSLDGVRYDGSAATAAGSAAPYGPINRPGAAASANGTVITYSWSAPARNGRDISRIQININNGGFTDQPTSGSIARDMGHSYTGTIVVRATDAAGQVSEHSASARTADPPPQRAWVSQGANSGNCSPDVCYYLRLNTSNFPAGTYEVWCYEDGRRFGGVGRTNVPANGSVDVSCWHGGSNRSLSLEVRGWGFTENSTTWP